MSSDGPRFHLAQRVDRTRETIEASRLMAVAARRRIERSVRRLDLHRQAFGGLAEPLTDDEWVDAALAWEAEAEQRSIDREVLRTELSFRDGGASPSAARPPS